MAEVTIDEEVIKRLYAGQNALAQNQQQLAQQLRKGGLAVAGIPEKKPSWLEQIVSNAWNSTKTAVTKEAERLSKSFIEYGTSRIRGLGTIAGGVGLGLLGGMKVYGMLHPYVGPGVGGVAAGATLLGLYIVGSNVANYILSHGVSPIKGAQGIYSGINSLVYSAAHPVETAKKIVEYFKHPLKHLKETYSSWIDTAKHPFKNKLKELYPTLYEKKEQKPPEA